MAGAMRYKPSKLAAVLGIAMGDQNAWLRHHGFRTRTQVPGRVPVFWCVMVVGITSLNTWAAFSKNGSLATFTPFNQRERK